MSEIYVSLEEAAGLEGVAYTAMLNRIDRSFGSIRVKRVNQAKGGRPFTLVCLDSLSSKAQRAYRKKRMSRRRKRRRASCPGICRWI